MREDICSIPISEIFEPKDGCPFCRMRDMLEDRMATYITGAAMMEPDVRVETNRLGFCHQHFEQILQRGSRLSVALILESLLDEAGKEILPEDDKLAPKKILAAADRRAHSCFVCENVEKNMPRKNFQPFAAETKRLAKNYLDTVKADTTHFCRMFDYRNAGGDWGNSRDAIERAITYLTSREPTVTTKTEGKNR